MLPTETCSFYVYVLVDDAINSGACAIVPRSIVPTAATAPAVRQGLQRSEFAAEQATRGTAVLVPPTKTQRASMPKILQ